MMQVSSAMDGSKSLTCKRPAEAEVFQSMRRSESPETYSRLPKARVGSSKRGTECRMVPCGERDGMSTEAKGTMRGYTTTYSASDSLCMASLNPRISPVEMNNGPTG